MTAQLPIEAGVATALLHPQRRVTAIIALCSGIFSTSLLAAYFSGPILALFAPVPFLVSTILLRNRLFPGFSSHSRFNKLSLWIISVSSSLYFMPKSQLSSTITDAMLPIANNLNIDYLANPLVFNSLIVALICFTTIGFNIRLHIYEIIHPPVNPNNSIDAYNRSDFNANLKRYCNALLAELDRYDKDVNWSDNDLTPLEAEVESERSVNRRPLIVSDLVEAIRGDRISSVFIILGDPGSGKSVSLRRLVRMLCGQATDTGVVPVYINLREYPVNEKITTESLVRFVREAAFLQTGRDGRAFLDIWYETFRKNGHLLFVFDSFDELPQVLDCDDLSESHKQISYTFDRLFTQEFQSCHAVLASRHFRAPVGVKGTRLLIRPFSESQIRQAMQTWLKGWGIDSDLYIRKLFSEKPHLVPSLRNPFTAELIAEHARSGAGEKLPDSMFAVFDQYLTERFTKDLAARSKSYFSTDELRKGAATIAEQMYKNQDFGLEADLEYITSLLNDSFSEQAHEVIEALRYSRIVRVGGHDRRRFSFVHRRFAEFFVVDAIIKTNADLPIESIPTDSRWRDCLVMLCGIADLTVRKRIAEYCWSVIVDSLDELLDGNINEARDAIHCSRFLADAFRSDPEAIEDVQAPLGGIVSAMIESESLLSAKIAAEMIPLIDSTAQQEAITNAFNTKSPWICDTTFGSCRHLASIDFETRNLIRNYMCSLKTSELINRFKDLNFSMGLSDAFRKQRIYLNMYLTEVCFLTLISLAICCYAVIDPWLIIGIAFITGILTLINMRKEIFHNKNSYEYYSRNRYTFSEHKLDLIYLRNFISIGLGQIVFHYLYSSKTILSTLHIRTELFVLICILLFGVFGIFRTYILLSLYLVLMALKVNIYPDFILVFKTVEYLLSSIIFCELGSWIWGMINLGTVVMIADTHDREKIFKILISQIKKIIFWCSTKKISLSIIPMVIFATAVICSVLLLISKWGILPYFVKICINVMMGFSLILICCFFMALLYKEVERLISDLYPRISDLWHGIHDHRRLRQSGFPPKISCDDVYSTCQSYRSKTVRRQYLERLRCRRVPLIGEITLAPEDLLLDPLVAEEIARLHEQWYGFAG